MNFMVAAKCIMSQMKVGSLLYCVCTEIFLGRVIPVTSKSTLQWIPCQAPGVIGSAPGLVGPVSVYCDWGR